MFKNLGERLKDCPTLVELRNEFSVLELSSLARDGVLQDWLKSQLLELEARALNIERIKTLDNDQLRLLICKTLGIDITLTPNHEAQLVEREIDRQRTLDIRRRECGTDGIIVTNQRELADAVKNPDVHKFYLYDNEYVIPLGRVRTTYDGRGNAVIDVKDRDGVLDFDGNEIYFYNLTIVFHYLKPKQVKINHSIHNHNRLIFLDADRVDIDGGLDERDVEKLLMGRAPFESPNHFRDFARRMKGMIVGTVLLEPADYDAWHEAFFIHPVWNVEFSEPIRRAVRGARLCFNVAPDEAQQIFTEYRKQLIYADFDMYFDNLDDRASIKSLFLKSLNGKRYEIARLYPTSAWQFSSGIAGYGLQLITNYS